MTQTSVEPTNEDPNEWANPRLTGMALQTNTDQRIAQRRLADAVRELNEAVVSYCGTPQELDAFTSRVTELTDLIATAEPITPYLEYAIAQTTLMAAGELDSDPQTQRDHWTDYFDLSMMIGRTNPLSPPVELQLHDDKITGLVTCGRRYEGPPGCVHGGYIAAVFDELLGCAQSLSGGHGMTVNLDVTYQAPTPINQELELHAWVESYVGRKIVAKGTMSASGVVTAVATGVFITIDGSKFRNPRSNDVHEDLGA